MTDKLSSPRAVRDMLASLGATPSKALGQNFLIDANIVDILVEAADVGPVDRILEIGPGLGVLTDALAERAEQVVAVEMDRTFAAHLKRRYEGRPGVTVLEGDFLEQDIPKLLADNRIGKVAANLPYNTGTRMLVELMRGPAPPAVMVVTVQMEVGDRLAAVSGDDGYGLLSVWTGVGYKVERIRKVSPTCFYPKPAVWSAVMRLTSRDPAGPVRRGTELFYALTRQAFQHRRKQLAGILDRAPAPLRVPPEASVSWLEALGADPKARPEELSVEQWLALAGRLDAYQTT